MPCQDAGLLPIQVWGFSATKCSLCPLFRAWGLRLALHTGVSRAAVPPNRTPGLGDLRGEHCLSMRLISQKSDF